MPVLTNYSPDLTGQALIDYLADAYEKGKPKDPFESEKPNYPGYVLSKDTGFQPVHMLDAVDGNEITVPWAYREYYSVIQVILGPDGQVKSRRNLGDTDIVVPMKTAIVIEVRAWLLLQSAVAGTSNAQVLEQAFSAYSYPASGDLNQYLEKLLANNPTLTDDMFIVDYSCAVTPKQTTEVMVPSSPADPMRPFISVREREMDLFRGRATFDGGIRTGPSESDTKNAQEYFQRMHIELKYIDERTTVESSIPPRLRDSAHQVEVKKEEAEQKVNETGAKEYNFLGCDKIADQKNYKIAVLTSYPEFKTEERLTELIIPLPCGHRLILRVRLPHLMIRTAEVTLWGYLRFPKLDENPVAPLVDMIEKCFWASLAFGSVVGVALGNIALAIAAFKALFADCIETRLTIMAGCILPGLMLTTDSTEWTDV